MRIGIDSFWEHRPTKRLNTSVGGDGNLSVSGQPAAQESIGSKARESIGSEARPATIGGFGKQQFARQRLLSEPIS